MALYRTNKCIYVTLIHKSITTVRLLYVQDYNFGTTIFYNFNRCILYNSLVVHLLCLFMVREHYQNLNSLHFLIIE